jgi:predicted membrane metal-binding protein
VRVEELRYPRVGQVKLLGTVLAALGEDGVGGRGLVGKRVSLSAIHLAWRNSAQLEIGSTVAVQAQLSLASDGDTPWSFDSYLLRRGIVAEGQAELVSEPLHGAPALGELPAYRNEAHGAVWSLALGTRDVVSQDLERKLRELGLAHLLVFSGFQVMLAGGVVSAFTRWILVKVKCGVRADLLGALAGTGASLLLTALSGWEPSGIRAVCALLLISINASLIGAPQCSIQRLVSALIAVSLLFPGAIFEPGVQLTFAALLGFVVSPFGGFLAPAITASVVTALVSLVWFGEWAPIGVLLNPFLGPLLSLTGCLIAYPVIALEWLTNRCGFGAELSSFLVDLLGELNIGIISTVFALAPRPALLAPSGISLWLTGATMALAVGWLVLAAFKGYLMRNGVALGDARIFE